MYGAWLNQSARDKAHAKAGEVLEQHAVPMEWVEKVDSFSSKSTEHQGVVLKTSLYPYTPKEDLFENRRPSSSIISRILTMSVPFAQCGGVRISRRMPANAGVPEVYPSVVKVSAGATEFMQIARDASANQYARKAQEAGYQIAALT